ncbi:hypothetical protein TNCV_2271111 [Trichonephila clavipes]|nr:hypothetical protein TNCV_2271111 [Trichonephila clavipes]
MGAVQCSGNDITGVSLQTDHLIWTSAHAPQRPMSSSRKASREVDGKGIQDVLPQSWSGTEPNRMPPVRCSKLWLTTGVPFRVEFRGPQYDTVSQMVLASTTQYAAEFEQWVPYE